MGIEVTQKILMTVYTVSFIGWINNTSIHSCLESMIHLSISRWFQLTGWAGTKPGCVGGYSSPPANCMAPQSNMSTFMGLAQFPGTNHGLGNFSPCGGVVTPASTNNACSFNYRGGGGGGFNADAGSDDPDVRNSASGLAGLRLKTRDHNSIGLFTPSLL